MNQKKKTSETEPDRRKASFHRSEPPIARLHKQHSTTANGIGRMADVAYNRVEEPETGEVIS